MKKKIIAFSKEVKPLTGYINIITGNVKGLVLDIGSLTISFGNWRIRATHIKDPYMYELILGAKEASLVKYIGEVVYVGNEIDGFIARVQNKIF